jgi:hypothetical protein
MEKSETLEEKKTLLSLILRISALENALIKAGVLSVEDIAKEMIPIVAQCEEKLKKLHQPK